MSFLDAIDWKAKHWGNATSEHPGFDTEQCILPVGTGFEGACCENPISGLATFYNKQQKFCDSQGLVQKLADSSMGMSFGYRK